MNKRFSYKRILNIAEILVLAGITVFVILVLRQGVFHEVSMEQIRIQMEQQPGIKELSIKDDALTRSCFELIPSSYIYYKSDDIMDVRELLIAKALDDAEMDTLQEAVQKRLDRQIDIFSGYGTNQLDLLQHAVVMQRGNYCFYAVGDEAQQWQEAFLATK